MKGVHKTADAKYKNTTILVMEPIAVDWRCGRAATNYHTDALAYIDWLF